ncbi:o-succinylbenzoate synthase [Desulfotalea psychrophila]|uniref:o-succinylbenzoate synthase n=1 Tax=Desulfotalea psychrophila (strain LSv54 / DSM 12343) TaxID=177439 RepID=MENC_DESPS|nr:RecName: Full=o-succinylbenzoate synthase; Short=OSB synthase; Short=OSBS; AltName: Full=4-(2'-carboxyphenyl)-4-oxybutyric acid synthase; AltName: Full=o-succinylbenzoic acid synthase [Desulfotalea psychrophila LSv54]CAG34980.1 related to N-acylamino acid racemase (MenC) [Desulfotalea psychrophila LSv54]
MSGMELSYRRSDLIFKRPAGTSRGVLTSKPTWFVRLDIDGHGGQGEVSLIPGLSLDPEEQIGRELDLLARRLRAEEPIRLRQFLAERGGADFSDYRSVLTDIAGILDSWQVSTDGRFPALRFALEMALLDLLSGGRQEWFASDFTRGEKRIPVNGLIWMGEAAFMQEQIEAKLAEGYGCLKLKIGAIDFDKECALLAGIRESFSPQQLEIRVDANGAFSPANAPQRLKRLSQFHLHSIEQPIRQHQWSEMAALCANSPLAIALDEELIGLGAEQRSAMLDAIRPQYIILKPSLLGGFHYAGQWIELARERGIGFWITSALESNLGLAAIAQWTALYQPTMPQGLGTGQLYTNNLPSNLAVDGGLLGVS